MAADLSVVREHYLRYLGTAPTIVDRQSGVDIALYSPIDNSPFSTAATIGLSTLSISAIVPQELTCSVKPDQSGAAVVLVRLAMQLVLSQRRGLVDEDVIPNGGPLLTGTEVSGILTGAHPYLPDEFNVLFGEDGKPVLNFITLVPLVQAEVDFTRRESVDDLMNLFERESPDLCDVTRSSAL